MRSTATLFLVALMALLAMTGVQGFVRGTSRTHSQPVLVTGRNTQLHAVAKKKAAKKKSDVETIRKAELVASIAEKLDCTKAEADASLAAVLGTVTEVSTKHTIVGAQRHLGFRQEDIHGCHLLRSV